MKYFTLIALAACSFNSNRQATSFERNQSAFNFCSKLYHCDLIDVEQTGDCIIAVGEKLALTDVKIDDINKFDAEFLQSDCSKVKQFMESK